MNHPKRLDQALRWRFRLKASLLHLTASVALAAVLAAVIFALWFPGAYRSMSGGSELFVLLMGVDVTIGPLITLAVADRRKTRMHLATDIAVIVVLQLTALGYGLNTLSISRPVVLALEDDRFRVVAAMDVYQPELATAAPEYRRLSLTGPRLLRSLVPTDPVAKTEALKIAMHGYDVGSRPALWRPWDAAARAEALAHAKPLSFLRSRYPNRKAELAAAVSATARPPERLVFLPMLTFRGDWVALLDAGNGDVVGYAPFDGF
jgi:hypothetical protein